MSAPVTDGAVSPGQPALAHAEYDVIPIAADGVMYALNSHGEGAGQTVSPDGTMRAVWFRSDGVVELGTLGGSASCARGINGQGTIVGGSLTAGDDTHHAFVYDAGVMRDLNSKISRASGWELVQALSINDRGEIAAIGHKDGADYVVVLRPRVNDP